ncbi:glycoside hydrolase family 5 protein [Serpula lacrymans var. lacrymans S7.3]|uniref:mannan endo-1,4-beta-mannosidase n=2 Tax=Serpula lacrymans var. lacrymans TaxID=341189 RepID=F8PZP8_SERL3|nr:glycoside hydrolase family 5 protein [Serpula lacrymans var. lacrymans S7.9]EGN98370.1 glycoside hydrolase family 5 protein [Serpula lacrymans var. lacrymans S7.3]EGO23925.1 glycoside hydrolase family 5 protein [Serpula lacrymans var. lacrymans S7.9]
MKLTGSLSALALAAFSLKTVSAANSFAGSNLYYAAGLDSATRGTLLDGLQSAGMKVLRVWLDGQSTTQKGTNIDPFPDLEPNVIGTYNDTVLERLDDFMIDAQAHGIKLLISMHSFNALQAGDVYGKQYGTGYFYEQTQPQQQFDARLTHVLNHNHTTLGKPWSQLSDYIFAFEAENEAMIGQGQTYIQDHQQWQCDRASTIKGVLGSNSNILVVTGGESWMAESVQPNFLNCSSLDVISIHSYGTGDFATSSIQTYVQQAQSAGKKLLFEEWGACYFSTSNNNCPTGSALDADTRNSNIKTWASQIDAAGVPWLYWQVLPNADPHQDQDFEVGLNDSSWSTLQAAAQAALQATAAFDYSSYLL